MKRIANKVALQTLLYTVTPNTNIKVVNFENLHDVVAQRNGEVMFLGHAGDMVGYKHARETASQVRKMHLEIIDGKETFVVSICENVEEY